MNIFFVERNPYRAAEMLVDKHVVKMILETAQILSTAKRMTLGTERIDVNDKGRKVRRWVMEDVVLGQNLYAATHINHPSVVWARSHPTHYHWLLEHFVGLLDEYTYRYEKKHKCSSMYKYLCKNPLAIEGKYKIEDATDPPCAMPDEYKISSDAVENYREYYRKGKVNLHKWTKRDPPSWL